MDNIKKDTKMENNKSKSLKLDSEFFGSGFGLVGAAFISFGVMSGFFAFLISNIFFIYMALDKKMKPFFILQIAFLITSVIGIYNNFL